MKTELIIDGNAVYEIDLECRRKKLERADIKENQKMGTLELMGGQFSSRYRRLFFGVMLIYALQSLKS